MRPAWCASPRSSGEPIRRRTCSLGDDVLSQTDIDYTQAEPVPVTSHLLYDGHGSTRQVSSSGATVTDSYSYDAYGTMLGGNPTSASPTATSLLYTGEQFDEHAQQYYLRARYYDPLNGRFNRTDPWAGSPPDPQSLHKYLYCHANPVNGADPTGMWTLVEVCSVTAIISTVVSVGTPIVFGTIAAARAGISPWQYWQKLFEQATWEEALKSVGFSALTGAVIITLARKLAEKAVALIGIFMSVVSLINSLQLANSLLNGRISKNELPRFLALTTASIILMVILSRVASKVGSVRQKAEGVIEHIKEHWETTSRLCWWKNVPKS